MESMNVNEEALALLQKYNKEEFHIRHALTVSAVMPISLAMETMLISGLKQVWCMI